MDSKYTAKGRVPFQYADEDTRAQEKPEGYERFVLGYQNIETNKAIWVRAIYCRTREDFEALLAHYNTLVWNPMAYRYAELTDH